MNKILVLLTQLLFLSEGEGGLFDFNATLPLMALQFIILVILLIFIFYKPISNNLQKREDYISANLAEATQKLLKAEELCVLYEEQLKKAKINSQSVIAEAENGAKEIVAIEISQARQDTTNLIAQTNKELEAQKVLALKMLETQIDDLSKLIKEKLLGKQAVL